MDFSKFKNKAIELKNKAIELKNKGVDFSVEKISKSSLVLKSQEEFNDFILKSQNTTFTNKEWVTKVYEKRCALIIWDSQKDFFREVLLLLPILLTKWFSQNLPLKVVDIQNKMINLDKYNLTESFSMIIFENKEIYKTIIWENNIKKVVKSLNLDINKSIEEI